MTFTQAGVDITDELRETPTDAESDSATGWGWMFLGLDAVLAESGAVTGAA
jgi:hypothetical protein